MFHRALGSHGGPFRGRKFADSHKVFNSNGGLPQRDSAEHSY